MCGGGGVHAVPAYAVYGSKDPDFPDPTKEFAELSARFPQLSSSFVIENAGHYPQVEDPQKVYEGISASVASHIGSTILSAITIQAMKYMTVIPVLILTYTHTCNSKLSAKQNNKQIMSEMTTEMRSKLASESHA